MNWNNDPRETDGRWVSRMSGPDGKQVRTWVMLPVKMSTVNFITARHTAFSSMQQMMDAKGGYNPTIECSQRSRYIMAECYDILQEFRGDDRRAYRYVNGAMLQANMAACEELAIGINTNPYGVHDSLEIWSNQADREAYVLAVDGDNILIEYSMPAGSTAMLQYTVRGGKLCAMKNVSYNACPKYWIELMRANDIEWDGHGQRGSVPFPRLAA